jgi:ElaB/YqjD/DUF883 family membrane-anchored ribosome-binding protein
MADQTRDTGNLTNPTGTMAGAGPESLVEPDDLQDGVATESHERIETGIEELRLQVSEAQRTLREIAGELGVDDEPAPESIAEMVKDSIERQPLTAVVLAGLVGFFVGSIHSRGSRS